MEATGRDAAASAPGGRLREEIRQSRPFRSAAEEAVLALLRTTDEVSRRVALAVEPFGMTVQQYNVLRILRGAGTAGLPTLDIADRMIERTPGITRLIDKLEAKGLVNRMRGFGDRRQVLCRITPSGLDAVAAIAPGVDARVDQVLRALDPGESERLITLLDKIREGLA